MGAPAVCADAAVAVATTKTRVATPAVIVCRTAASAALSWSVSSRVVIGGGSLGGSNSNRGPGRDGDPAPIGHSRDYSLDSRGWRVSLTPITAGSQLCQWRRLQRAFTRALAKNGMFQGHRAALLKQTPQMITTPAFDHHAVCDPAKLRRRPPRVPAGRGE